MSRLGLRARLAIALCAVAIIPVALATLVADYGVAPRLNDAAQTRLQRSAEHMSKIATAIYRAEGGWTPAAAVTLGHLAELDELGVVIHTPDGRTVVVRPLRGPPSESQRIVDDGKIVGSLVVSPAGGSLLTPEASHLQHSLDRLHLAAAVVAVIAALVIALLLAETLSRPLRRIRRTAEAIEQGDLQARVALDGDAEIKAVGHALNRLAETLDHEEQLRKQSVADLAHELRTPVHGILSRIEAAQDGVLDDTEANLAAMHAEALRLTRLLDDLSRLADAEQPGLLLEKRVVDLAEIAEAAAATFAAQFAEAEITFDVAAVPAVVSGEADRLRQIIDNLLSNALRYTEAGGKVRLSVRQEGSSAILEIDDTGLGIPADDLKNIYMRFWRGEKSRSRATGGTGIGLAIVSELVRAHGGRIEVDSEVGEGTRFRVFLSLAEARNERKREARATTTSGPETVAGPD